MSTTIPQRDLRNHNAQIIERVRAGEQFIVTRDGVPVADLTPHDATTRPPRWVPARDVPRWGQDDTAAQWLADIRALDEVLDDSVDDPWGEKAR